MPFSVSHIRCRVDPDLDSALFDFQERLGDQYLGAQAILDELESIRTRVADSLTDPLKSSLDQVLAVADTSTEAMEDAMSLVIGGTTEDVESSIADRYGINVVNGRVIPDGELDISALQELARLVGRIEDVLSYIPELEDLPIDTGYGSSFMGLVEFSPRFLFVTTYTKQTIVPATKCSPEIIIDEEVTAGVDVPLSSAAASVGVSVEDLRIYIFWIGQPDAGSSTRSKARSMGLTNSQFVDAASLISSVDFVVLKIDDPMDILRLLASFGSDIDDVLRRVTGPIELFENPRQVLSSIRDTFGRASGGSGPTGFRDLSSPAASLLSVLDIDKTFGLSELFDSLSDLDPSGTSPSTFSSGLAAAVKSQIFALSATLAQAQELLQGVLNQLSNLQSIVFNIFSDLNNGLFDCLFGSDFSPSQGFPDVGIPGLDSGVGGVGGPGTPGTPGIPTDNPLENVISLIEGQASLVREFTSSLGDLFGSISSISCTGGFLASAIGSSNSFPGASLDCVSQKEIDLGIEIPEIALEALGTMKDVMDFTTGLFDFANSNMKNLRLTTRSLGLSIRQTMSSRSESSSVGTGSGGCASPEVAKLASALKSRASDAFSSAGDL